MFKFKLRELRKEKDIPAKYIAYKLGVQHGTVNMWERGTHYPTIDHLYKICEILECTPNDLLVKESD